MRFCARFKRLRGISQEQGWPIGERSCSQGGSESVKTPSGCLFRVPSRDLPLTTRSVCQTLRSRIHNGSAKYSTQNSGRSLGVCVWQIHGLGLLPKVPRILELFFGLKVTSGPLPVRPIPRTT